MAKSIIQAQTDKLNRECFLCRIKTSANLPHEGLHKHHMIHGTANRRLAEKWGLWCYLCHEHHEQLHDHNEDDLFLMQVAQGRFEKLYNHEKWMEIFGKNYLIF